MPLNAPATTSLAFAGSGTLKKVKFFGTDTSVGKLSFSGHGRLVIETAVVVPPSAVTYTRRNSITMPTPTLDSRGRPT